jgi:hypothetical protein
VTKVRLVFLDDTSTTEELTFEQYKKMFLEGKWESKPLRSLEVVSKDSNKGPNRITFA